MVVVTNQRRAFKVQVMIIRFLMFHRLAIIRPLIRRRFTIKVPRIIRRVLLSNINSLLRFDNFFNISNDLMYLHNNVNINPRINKAINAIRALTKAAKFKRQRHINVITNRKPPQPISRLITITVLIIITI